MEQFKSSIEKCYGIKLTDPEIEGILTRFSGKVTADGKFNSVEILEHIKSLVDTNLKASKKYVPQDRYMSGKSQEEIFDLISSRLTLKCGSMRGDNPYQKAIVFFSENRASEISRAQLKSALLYRLALNFTDAQIDMIFDKLDPERSGSVKIRQLAAALVKNEGRHASDVSLNLASMMLPTKGTSFSGMMTTIQPPRNTGGIPESPRVAISYDSKITGLVAPDPAICPKLSVDAIEGQIRDRLFERSGLGTNMMQSLVRAFGDLRTSGSTNQGITREQLYYTIWNRFNMRISETDLERFYRKYDPKNEGFMHLSKFADGIIKGHSMNEPLLDDASKPVDAMRDDTRSEMRNPKNNLIVHKFLSFVRQSIKEVTNRDSRAPHYLLHNTQRMTPVLARAFFESKLNIRVEDEMIALLLAYFPSNGLLDMKRFMYTAMNMPETGSSFEASHGLIGGAAVNIDELPLSLKSTRYTHKEIEELLYRKISERLTTNHPFAYLHRIFQDPGQDTSNLVSVGKVRNILRGFDIVVCEEDFQKFIGRYDRGDGLVDVKSFVHAIMAPDEKHHNSFIPKAGKDFQVEESIARTLGTLTGKRREVSHLAGPTYTRLQYDPTNQRDVNSATPADALVEEFDEDHTILPSEYAPITDDMDNLILVRDAVPSPVARPKSANIAVKSTRGILSQQNSRPKEDVDRLVTEKLIYSTIMNNDVSKIKPPGSSGGTTVRRPQSAGALRISQPSVTAVGTNNDNHGDIQLQIQRPYATMNYGSVNNASLTTVNLELVGTQAGNGNQPKMMQTQQAMSDIAKRRPSSAPASRNKVTTADYNLKGFDIFSTYAKPDDTDNNIKSNAVAFTIGNAKSTGAIAASRPQQQQQQYPNVKLDLSQILKGTHIMDSTIQTTSHATQTTTPTPSRPTSAAPSKSTGSPRPTSAGGTSSRFTHRMPFESVPGQPYSPRPKPQKFTSTGQPRSHVINPYSHSMMFKYQHNKQMPTATSQQAYGVFIKTLNYQTKRHDDLLQTQHLQTLREQVERNLQNTQRSAEGSATVYSPRIPVVIPGVPGVQVVK